MAVPVGLAMLIGKLLCTFNEAQLYEHIPGGAAALMPPLSASNHLEQCRKLVK